MYFQKLAEITELRGRLCVGIDPQPSVLDAWGLSHNVSGVERCARGIVAAIGDLVAVFKPQSGFFEPFGSAGMLVLERVLSDIRAVGALSLLDVKRGDIGSTMNGYAQGYLNDEAPLAADAITLSPYLGFGSLQPAFELAIKTGRGVYVLARTSNPEGREVQLAKVADITVAQRIVDAARSLNATEAAGAIGLVIGGTHSDIRLNLKGFNGSILVPGIGAQGGQIGNLSAIFGEAYPLVLPSVSREMLNIGPNKVQLETKLTQLISEIDQNQLDK